MDRQREAKLEKYILDNPLLYRADAIDIAYWARHDLGVAWISWRLVLGVLTRMHENGLVERFPNIELYPEYDKFKVIRSE